MASGKAREMEARRIAIDALEVVLRLFDTAHRLRSELHRLNDWLQEAGLATLLTVRPASRSATAAFEEFFYSMGDCVIEMQQRVVAQTCTHRLRVVKYRGSAFAANEHPYVIADGGLRVVPISAVGLRHKPLGERICTGVSGLDRILAGGYRRASCVLFAGLPGTGKTLLAATFVAAACERGERVLYVSLEESQDALVENVRSGGIDLRAFVANGRLRFLCHYPEAMGAEQHLVTALDAIEEMSPAHVVVDAISACARMGGQQAAFEYLMRLLNACKERGTTILLTNQTTGTGGIADISGENISSMVDTVIRLEYCEQYGETTRLLSVVKARGSAHSNQKREYLITDTGIQLMDPYVGAGEVLTGTARQVQEDKDRLEAERVAYEIGIKELELERLRAVHRQLSAGTAARSAMRGAAGCAAAPPVGHPRAGGSEQAQEG